MAKSIDLLRAYVLSKPEGFYIEDVRREFEWSTGYIGDLNRELRKEFSLGPSNLVVGFTEHGWDRWKYVLTEDPKEQLAWLSNRGGDNETRIETMLNIVSSSIIAADGTILSRVARRLGHDLGNTLVSMQYIREELEAIS